ncbi:hypothetical protein JG687_00001808 [Phytophthora cactorum]|uniref:Uncharacterized protein n=1 Tax=Phytophthora cactorum TaxID=29920 RepID=A0A8T1V100_9STRA|nr:hypothetical protein JG687_00001808 [Phytophthora cactorum]
MVNGVDELDALRGASSDDVAEDDDDVTAKDVRVACISSRAQLAYRGSLRAISKWIIESKKNETPSYFDATGQIELTRFTPVDFEAFLLEKRKTVTISTLNSYRGTTGGPSIAIDCLRVGWSLGGVQGRYSRYESAGDQYLDRVVAGLPLNQAEFAAQPPHFDDNNAQCVGSCVKEMFPDLKDTSTLQDILKLCIASLSHPLLSSNLFRHPKVITQLRSQLVGEAASWMKPTGIPPHVELYKQLKCLQSSIDNLPPVLLGGMSNLIEEKGVAAGNITKDMLESTIEILLKRYNVATTETGDGDTAYYYNVKFHLLPESFEFPHAGPFASWMLWWFGDKARNYPPLRKIRPHDLPKSNKGKRYSDWAR